MIYFDNSATTFPKPQSVTNAVFTAMRKFGANPGRSGHTMSRESGNLVENCRQTAMNMFGANAPEDVVFTLNCTMAINMVIKGLLKKGDHVVTSCIEHNAVMRPLNKLEKEGIITYTKARVYPCDNDKTVDSFRKAINSKTSLIITTHASNVWGIKMPIERVAALGKVYGIPILVDGAQSAGIVPINTRKSGIDYLALAGHKGLYGPMGTGMLITGSGKELDTIIEGGTGTSSMVLCQPKEMPQKLESGTPNLAGICGLKAGMDFVNSKGIENISRHETQIVTHLYENMRNIPKLRLYMPRPTAEYFAPLISFNFEGKISDEVGKFLDANGIEVRTGLHCSPSAHEFIGTAKQGVVRVSPSVFSTMQEADKLIEMLKVYSKKI